MQPRQGFIFVVEKKKKRRVIREIAQEMWRGAEFCREAERCVLSQQHINNARRV